MQCKDEPATPGPHDAFELSAYDRTSSPPPEQVAKGMAEPKVYPEVKDAKDAKDETGLPESLQTVDFATYIGKVVGAATGDFKQLAIDHKEFFEKTISESDDINQEHFEKLVQMNKGFFGKQAEAFEAFDAKLDTMMRLTQVIIKLTRESGREGGPKPGVPDFDREAIEAAAFKKGFAQAKANDVKARKSMATQIRNLRLQLQEKEHEAPDEDIESISDGLEVGAAESAEEYRARKDKAKEKEREKKLEAREERNDHEWQQRFKPIVIQPKKRARTFNSPAPTMPSSSSSSAFSSSSAAGAGAFNAPGAPKKVTPKVKVYCEDCQADSEDACVCDEE